MSVKTVFSSLYVLLTAVNMADVSQQCYLREQGRTS
jgi:hypothetical protein